VTDRFKAVAERCRGHAERLIQHHFVRVRPGPHGRAELRDLVWSVIDAAMAEVQSLPCPGLGGLAAEVEQVLAAGRAAGLTDADWAAVLDDLVRDLAGEGNDAVVAEVLARPRDQQVAWALIAGCEWSRLVDPVRDLKVP
jgi:hypothetical protein